MVSNPGGTNHDEGWEAIDSVQPEEVCQHVRSDIHTDPAAAEWAAKLPNVIHYCQSYFLGPYFFYKRNLPSDILSCEHPLLKDPLDHEGVGFAAMYNSSLMPNNELKLLTPKDRNRHAFMLCYIITTMNDALTYWKQHHCSGNFRKEFAFHSEKPKVESKQPGFMDVSATVLQALLQGKEKVTAGTGT